MTDLVALIINTAGGFKIKGTMSTDGSFPLLVHPEAEAVKNPAVGMMEISVSNYLVEKYMSDEPYSKVFINEITGQNITINPDLLFDRGFIK